MNVLHLEVIGVPLRNCVGMTLGSFHMFGMYVMGIWNA